MDVASLERAYRATAYRVHLPGNRLELRVDQCNSSLRGWLAATGHVCAALITAHNPGSQLRSDEYNASAQQALLALLRERGFGTCRAENIDPSGEWPVEASLLVPGLTEAEARVLAREFGQVAFLWCDATGMPRLQLTDAPAPEAGASAR